MLSLTVFLSYLPEAGEYASFFVYLRLVSLHWFISLLRKLHCIVTRCKLVSKLLSLTTMFVLFALSLSECLCILPFFPILSSILPVHFCSILVIFLFLHLLPIPPIFLSLLTIFLSPVPFLSHIPAISFPALHHYLLSCLRRNLLQCHITCNGCCMVYVARFRSYSDCSTEHGPTNPHSHNILLDTRWRRASLNGRSERTNDIRVRAPTSCLCGQVILGTSVDYWALIAKQGKVHPACSNANPNHNTKPNLNPNPNPNPAAYPN